MTAQRMDGKQVALLCPTTVLAEQHYQTFRQRMEPFSITVGLLSRFVPTAGWWLVLAFVPAVAAAMASAVCSFFIKKEPKKF